MKTKEIKGIQILDREFKINQFADDASLILEGDSKSYEKRFGVLREFDNISGLKLNYEKTCNIWLGGKRNCAEKLLPHLNMCWNPPKFKILGLWFTSNLSDMAELNMADFGTLELQNVIDQWEVWEPKREIHS